MVGMLRSCELMCDAVGTNQLGQRFSDAVVLFKRCCAVT
jgi:hypothetical protein